MENFVEFKEGDSIKVSQKITEGKKERVTSFSGVVTKIKGSGENKTFTVKQTLEGIEVERIFPICSPAIASISRIEDMRKKKKRNKKKKK
ncbi:50S ribosomal protein L19 [Candidatus Parcubacteria bacterium]|nr:MAG: 50S ribosomal protein L19 [Candidatus Parcubacteria bacterium]